MFRRSNITVGRALGQHALLGQHRLKECCGTDQIDAFVAEDFGYCIQQHVGRTGIEVKQQLGQAPVRTNAAEDLLVLHLAGHHSLLYAGFLEGFDKARQLTQRQPIDGDGRVRNWRAGSISGIGLFTDSGNDRRRSPGPAPHRAEGKESGHCRR